MKTSILVAVCLLLVGFCGMARASDDRGLVRPYFNCNNTNSELGAIICSDNELVGLDWEMAASLSRMKQIRHNDPDTLKKILAEQKRWIQSLNDKCFLLNDGTPEPYARVKQISCIKSEYKKQLVIMNHPDISAPLTEQKLYDMISYLEDKDCSDMSRIGEVENPEALQEFSCKYFTVDPKKAAKLFGNCVERSKEQFAPVCNATRKIDLISAMPQYIEQLEHMRGDNICLETSRYAHYRSARIDELLLLYDGDVNQDKFTTFNEFDESRIFDAKQGQLAHWARQGLWEKEQYALLKQLRQEAERGLKEYYMDVLKWPSGKAQHVAKYYTIYLANDYLGSTGPRSVARYPTRHTDLDDLDAYLKEDEAGRAKYKEELGYLLRLAIVNDYSVEDIETIIANGAPIDGGTSGKFDTPLMQAVMRPDVVELLLKRGANVNAQNNFGKTPLMYALQYNNKDAIRLLLSYSPNLSLATYETEECGNDALAIEAGDRTALMYAAWYDKPDVIKALIGAGANINDKDSDEDTGYDYLDRNMTLTSREREKAEDMLLRR